MERSLKPLTNKIALVTGATRGLGKGIAIGLGEAGATVYITGRTQTITENSLVGGTLAGTQEAVEAAGGKCIPIRIDHENDSDVKALFDRIAAEQNGRLDILVNNVFAGVVALQNAYEQKFWEAEPKLWDACHNVGLRSHYVASVYAARLMVERGEGAIFTISSWGGLRPIFGAAYGAGKAAADRLAAELAAELKSQGISAHAIWPGIVGTEHISRLVEASDAEEAEPNQSFSKDRFNWETPLLTGRAIAALAADPRAMQTSGRVRIVAELARQYDLVQEDNRRPASLRSLRFILPYFWPSLRPAAQFIPDLWIPWPLLLLSSLTAPRV
ncbi:MAG: SDR family NAD(P)-dependent oxidoreductase [Cyanobacteria bacterium J06641_5]